MLTGKHYFIGIGILFSFIISSASHAATENFETGVLNPAIWITSGDDVWRVSGENPGTGSFSAESPLLDDNEQATLETLIYCDTYNLLKFWFAVESEKNADGLYFYVNDKLESSWSGVIGYTTATCILSPGTHHIKWQYKKNMSESGYSDTAWLDDIELPDSDVPTLMETFETADFNSLNWVTSGDALWQVSESKSHSGSFSAESPDLNDNESSRLTLNAACSKGRISFWCAVDSEEGYDKLIFYIDDQLQGSWSGKTEYSRVTFPVSTGEHEFKWDYRKDGTQSVGDDKAWLDDICIPTYHQVTEDFETGEFSEALWATPSNNPWQITGQYPHGGMSSAQPSVLDDMENSQMKANITCDTGKVSFWFSTDTEKYRDYLLFYIDSSLKGRWSGYTDYTKVSYLVEKGNHTFTWRYSKNASGSSKSDTCYVDDIIFPGVIDSDQDGLPDTWEYRYFNSLTHDGTDDTDNDGVTDNEEYLNHTDPLFPDSDQDGIPDGYEISRGLNPTDQDAFDDPDNDAYSNILEYDHDTDPKNPDETPDADPDIENFESSDFSLFKWVMGGEDEWRITDESAYSGQFSATTPLLDENESSSLETTIYCDNSPVSIWYKTLSDPDRTDPLYFYLDNQLHGSLSASADYTRITFPVSSGPHNIKWVAVKNADHPLEGNTWLVDDIRLPVSGIPVVVEDFETGDFSGLSWSESREKTWDISSNHVHSGDFSAVTPNDIEAFERAVMATDATCEKGKMTFWISVDSEENFDYLQFFVDDSLKGKWSGKVSYSKITCDISNGKHNFKWIYEKDGSDVYDPDNMPEDAAWVDDIYFPGQQAGDVNGDGDIDGSDLIRYINRFDRTGINERDLNTLAEKFGLKASSL